MGLEYFAQHCEASTNLAAAVWCVTKEGTCCGVCGNTLASVGSRVGLTFAVFFATLVIVVDGAESPFVFLTTALQALAYLLVVLWEGLAGGGISRFHAFYALFCSFGWVCPLTAASITATHYGYGGSHQKTGVRLHAYRTDFSSASARPTSRAAHPSEARSLPRQAINRRGPFSLLRSLGRSPFFPSVAQGATRRAETRPLVWEDPTTSDYSPVLRPSPAEADVPPLSRRSSSRHARTRLGDEETPPAQTESVKRSDPRLRPTEHVRHTPATLLGLPLPELGRGSLEPSDPNPDRSRLVRSVAHSARPPLGQERSSSPMGKELEKPGSRRSPSTSLSTRSSLLRHRSSASSSTDSSSRRGRPSEQSRTGPDVRASAETVYTPEQLKKIVRRVRASRWRRWGYSCTVAILSGLWLTAFLFVNGPLPSFDLAQTNCEDPHGTSILRAGSITFLALSPVILLLFVFNYHTQWLPRNLRRVFDYNRDGSHFTRFLLPAILSGLVFALWQILLWTSYELAVQPDSSLLGTTEESTTFASVLSLALCIKPVADLVKAIAKLLKRKRRERKELAHQQAAHRTPRATPTVLPQPPSSSFEGPKLEIPTFEPLEPPTIRISRDGSRRRGRIASPVPERRPSNVIGRDDRLPSPGIPRQETMDSTPVSLRSSLSSRSDEEADDAGRRRRWIGRLSMSPGGRGRSAANREGAV
ncbi:hypothetical protein JCM10212_002896 [Sporobolomyces blumeae]